MQKAMSNPYLRRVQNSSFSGTGEAASIKGVAAKSLFFLALTGVGILIFRSGVVPISMMNTAMVVASVITLVTMLAGSFIPSVTPLVGSIFSISEGFVIGYVTAVYSAAFDGIIPLALGITFTVILTMLGLYVTGIVKFGQKTRAIITTLFFATAIIGIITFISSFFTSALSSVIYGNGTVGIGYSLLCVAISTLYLVIDFDNIANCVKMGSDKRQEWMLAFGLVVTILMLFMRILELLAKVRSRD